MKFCKKTHHHTSLHLVLITTLLATSSVYCAQQKTATPAFPRGCETKGFTFADGYLIVNDSGRQSFFLIHNKTENTIEMQRVETRQIFISPPLVAKIEPSNWAAFASDVPNFHFRCYVQQVDTPTEIDCSQALDICEYPRVRFALSNMGNYWVSSNKSQEQVINEAVAKGIYLKW